MGQRRCVLPTRSDIDERRSRVAHWQGCAAPVVMYSVWAAVTMCRAGQRPTSAPRPAISAKNSVEFFANPRTTGPLRGIGLGRQWITHTRRARTRGHDDDTAARCPVGEQATISPSDERHTAQLSARWQLLVLYSSQTIRGGPPRARPPSPPSSRRPRLSGRPGPRSGVRIGQR